MATGYLLYDGNVMEILKKFNNNVALAQDGHGREMIVLGKGVGFPAMPYTLTDLSKVERTFYDVNTKSMDALRELPSELLLAAADIAEQARDELDCPLNPNLPFTLADHLAFAVERIREGTAQFAPLAYDVEHLYPREYGIARCALRTLQEMVGVALPESEAVSITLHLLNSETEVGDMHSTLMTAQITAAITDIVEDFFECPLPRASFSYSRFAMHLRYLVQRMTAPGGAPVPEGGTGLYREARREYPQEDACAARVVSYLQDTWGWACSQDEKLYLLMHIHRVITSQ
ncbi:MAG: PRD domain-containing protein [Gemmiger sp.]|nr:PRD domain-containing protein [Gemmiger sp.]